MNPSSCPRRRRCLSLPLSVHRHPFRRERREYQPQQEYRLHRYPVIRKTFLFPVSRGIRVAASLILVGSVFIPRRTITRNRVRRSTLLRPRKSHRTVRCRHTDVITGFRTVKFHISRTNYVHDPVKRVSLVAFPRTCAFFRSTGRNEEANGSARKDMGNCVQGDERHARCTRYGTRRL